MYYHQSLSTRPLVPVPPVTSCINMLSEFPPLKYFDICLPCASSSSMQSSLQKNVATGAAKPGGDICLLEINCRHCMYCISLYNVRIVPSVNGQKAQYDRGVLPGRWMTWLSVYTPALCKCLL